MEKYTNEFTLPEFGCVTRRMIDSRNCLDFLIKKTSEGHSFLKLLCAWLSKRDRKTDDKREEEAYTAIVTKGVEFLEVVINEFLVATHPLALIFKEAQSSEYSINHFVYSFFSESEMFFNPEKFPPAEIREIYRVQ